MSGKCALCVVALLMCSTSAGCEEVARRVLPTKHWHQQFKWHAAEYFDAPELIALCKAIEANDLKEIDRLVATGVDVNAQGKGKMTPLLWAFPDNRLGRFKCLLKHGANPNVVVESEFGTHGVIKPGDSVTHMACETAFPGYFEAVFNNGGDPNLLKKTVALGKNDSPLLSVRGTRPTKSRRCNC